MSKRIGKYKISKRESAMSLVDGGTPQGSLEFNAAAIPSFSNAIEVDAATLTLAYATHAGRPVIQKQACVFTLPAIGVVGQTFWVINGAADGTLMTIAIDNADAFLWDVAGAAGTDSKDLYNTAATAKKGDYIKLAFGSATGWTISEMGGTWIDEA